MERFARGRSDAAFNAIAGAVGGFASGVVTCPLDVIKTKLQAQGGFRAQAAASSAPGAPGRAVYNGMLGTARVIWREEGIKGMYRGLGPIILGYLPTWAVWFTVYGKSKEYFSQTSGMYAMSLGWMELIQVRQSIRCQFLVLDSGWRILNDGHKPDLGHQNSTHVTSEQRFSSIPRGAAAMALSLHRGCSKEDVSHGRIPLVLLGAYTGPARIIACRSTVPRV